LCIATAVRLSCVRKADYHDTRQADRSTTISVCLSRARKADYRDTRQADRSISELKEFASQLKALPQISRHVALAELISRAIGQAGFRWAAGTRMWV
jgi:hypothetical protein